jgi:hypothetical protein
VTNIERSFEGVGKAATSRATGRVWACALLASLAGGCAGKSKPEADAPERDERSYYDDSSSTSSSSSRSDESGDKGSGSLTKVSNDEPAEPVFTEGMSVNEATEAVPPGIERRDIDQETLGKPLQDLSLYESCNPGGARFNRSGQPQKILTRFRCRFERRSTRSRT